MLIVLPLGLLTGAIVFDIVHLLTGGEQWPTVSYWLIPVGVLTGLAAAVFGIADWTKIPTATRGKRIGALHGFGNAVVVLLFAGSWLLRGSSSSEPGALALALSFAGGALALVTGSLGGELVDRARCGGGRRSEPGRTQLSIRETGHRAPAGPLGNHVAVMKRTPLLRAVSLIGSGYSGREEP
jgi:uncharacterized membrane protein